MKPGDWVQVKEEHDIPAIFRDNKPTRGRINSIENEVAWVWVPIGGADVDEHSQGVPYGIHQVEPVID